jgi:hypothetical protein
VKRRCATTGVDDSGVMFTSCGNSPYLSLNVHQARSGTKHPKSIWNRSRADECHVFCEAENRNWTDKRTGNRWAINNKGEEPLGTRRERLGFFYKPSYASGPWHGFPVGGMNGLKHYGRPPDEVVKEWLDDGIINYSTYSRITRGRF